MGEIFIIDKPNNFEYNCPECDFDCQCNTIHDKPYVSKTTEELVKEQEDRNSTAYWNDLRTS